MLIEDRQNYTNRFRNTIECRPFFFSFKKKPTQPRIPKVPPRSITTYLHSPNLEIGGFCSSSSHMMMKMKMLTRVEHGKGLVLVIT